MLKTKFQEKMMKRKAFTLIELLVVVAIIGILAAILFPVFARARENARRASCMSNMKQMAMSVMQYTQDYDEYYPLAWYGKNPAGTKISYTQTQPGTPGAKFLTFGPSSSIVSKGHWITWMDLIYPYVKSAQLFECPSFNNVIDLPESNTGLQYQMNGAYDNAAYTSYDPSLATAFVTQQYASDAPILYTSTPVSAIQRPSGTIMIYEARGFNCLYGLFGESSLLPQYGTSDLEPHLGGMNLAFGDGHVKWMSGSQILAQTGNGSTSACILEYANAGLYGYPSRPSCSKLWNPFVS
jgi:prepilin-type N-terminal cleavage/methylation domain-containing protein/prepilin-type processing-associated H-X9-DG protein